MRMPILYFLLSLLLFPVLNGGTSSAQVQELNLSDAISISLEHNYSIRISSSETRIAAINNSWGTAGRLPTIGFSASSSNNIDLTDNSTTNRLSGGIGLDWTIFSGFRVSITKQRLEELERLAGGRSAVVIENTIEDVILGYYFVLLQEESLEVLGKVMKLSEDRYNYELARQELGSSVTYKVLQAQNVYLLDKSRFMNQEVALRNAVRNFNFLLGEAPETVWYFTEEFIPDTSDYQLADLLNLMLSNNQVLQNQYVNLVLQQKQTELARSDMYPSLRLSTGMDRAYTRIGNENSDPITSSSMTPYGNLSLSYTLYNGGNRRSDIQIARINEEISQVETEEMEHSLTNQLMNVHDYYTVRKTLLTLANENLVAAELNLRIADEKFRTGVINSFNYRDIQLIYLNAALDRLEAIFNLVESRTALTRMTGGFLSPDEGPGN